MSRFQQFFLALLWLPLGLAVNAQATELHVTPKLCAIGEDEDMCSISVSVTFRAQDDKRYCLSISDRGLLECFDGAQTSKIRVYVAADEDVEFQVTEAATGTRIATTTLQVAKFRPKRHQRRYGWGLL